jgi:hypothetical protein
LIPAGWNGTASRANSGANTRCTAGCFPWPVASIAGPLCLTRCHQFRGSNLSSHSTRAEEALGSRKWLRALFVLLTAMLPDVRAAANAPGTECVSRGVQDGRSIADSFEAAAGAPTNSSDHQTFGPEIVLGRRGLHRNIPVAAHGEIPCLPLGTFRVRGEWLPKRNLLTNFSQKLGSAILNKCSCWRCLTTRAARDRQAGDGNDSTGYIQQAAFKQQATFKT